METVCDFSPLKMKLKEDLDDLTQTIQEIVDSLDNQEKCLLGSIEHVRERFVHAQSTAALFYLNCYLSPHTEKFHELSISIKNMSDRRHGALIAVERHDNLDDLLKNGIPVNAALSPALLESIFFPGSPLHDGAVLIRENQIVSAGNVLPLTYSVLADPKMGTRHRAAIGLSERSDALVLIVSEETARCSFALGGKLFPITSRIH